MYAALKKSINVIRENMLLILNNWNYTNAIYKQLHLSMFYKDLHLSNQQ